jgi:DNA polymerase V
VLTRYALAGLERIFQKGYAYSKAEVLLMDLCQRGEYTDDLFTPSQGAGADRLMKVMDVINHRYGRGMLRTARVTEAPFWAMRQDLMSPRYTTRIGHVWSVGNDKAIKNADS